MRRINYPELLGAGIGLASALLAHWLVVILNFSWTFFELLGGYGFLFGVIIYAIGLKRRVSFSGFKDYLVGVAVLGIFTLLILYIMYTKAGFPQIDFLKIIFGSLSFAILPAILVMWDDIHAHYSYNFGIKKMNIPKKGYKSS